MEQGAGGRGQEKDTRYSHRLGARLLGEMMCGYFVVRGVAVCLNLNLGIYT